MAAATRFCGRADEAVGNDAYGSGSLGFREINTGGDDRGEGLWAGERLEDVGISPETSIGATSSCFSSASLARWWLAEVLDEDILWEELL